MTGISGRSAPGATALAAASIMLTSLVGVAAGPAQAAPARVMPVTGARACTMETLPEPADTYNTDTMSMDPSGRYIVGTAIVRRGDVDSYPVLLWDRGRLIQPDIPLPESFGVDVNSSGVVVGNAYTYSVPRPWRYRAGKTTLLPVIDPADSVTLRGINARGDIVGVGVTPEQALYVLFWPAGRPGTVRTLDTPANLVDVVGIADDGTVVGFSGAQETPVSWARAASGAVRPLANPHPGDFAAVRAVGGHWAVGQGWGDGGSVGLRWDLRTGRATVLAPEVGVPVDVNAAGMALSGNHFQRGDTVVTLPSPSPYEPAAGRAIADNGTVAGYHNGMYPGGVRAVRWMGC